ncbi:RLA class II histocompatibility antigen, DP beta chain-like [Malaclemys terrapin pileata]|uniref:RLA class II histocompatibility antigen, DP beta chain-like n=1 Tax=Malaclemys terrapin pileata TaxID=2991368 RepID=UPI0023A88F46|nr:RLA class II histocompatibility antigen, DP beta chain-like [Malaclemys terrapin pileata]
MGVTHNYASRHGPRTVSLIPAAPRLSIPQRSAVTDTVTSFPCHVWGFYPGDVTVTWLRDGRVLTDATRSAPQRNPDGTFNLTLTYTFTPTESDSGSIFSCHVSHAALAQPLREEFPLAVTGADHTRSAIRATLGILVAGGAAALAIYCRRRRREARPQVSRIQVLPHWEPRDKVCRPDPELLPQGDSPDPVELGRGRERERQDPRNQPEPRSHVQRYQRLETPQ